MNLLHRPHRRRRGSGVLLGVAIVAAFAAASCRDDATFDVGDVDARDVLDRSAEQMGALTSFAFEVEHENGATEIVGGIQMVSATGAVQGTERMRLAIEARFANTNIQTAIVILPGEGYLQNPITGRWQREDNLDVSEFFDPALWRPEYPNPAFDNMRADDAFWAARIVHRFSDEAIRTVVANARFSEPGAAEYMSSTLIARRDKVVATWLTGVNPIVDPRLDADGMLHFDNAAVSSGVATAPTAYTYSWSRFDNATDANVGPVEQGRSGEPQVAAPPTILDGADFVAVSIQTVHPDFPQWERPVRIHFRRSADGWDAVGLEREYTGR